MTEEGSPDTRTLLVKTTRETFRITVPAEWKITFGSPGGNRGGFGSDGNELRLYETDKQQRACFTSVVSFRDLSIPVTKLVKHKSGDETWEDDGEGNVTRKQKTKTVLREVEEE